MKRKIVFLSLFLILSISGVSAQSKDLPQSIISKTAVIRGYHVQQELKEMNKGELLELYIERIKVLVKILPHIALATKPGVTLGDLGIPNNADNKKSLASQDENCTKFLESTVEFQRTMVPYSDTRNLINAILFYENIMKSLHEFDSN
jgi:hypothetical protein